MSRNHLPFRLLIVDDNQQLCYQLSMIFEAEKWQITKCHNGSEALDKLRNSTFDLMLLDLGLPQIGGQTILRYVQDNEIMIRVIILSSNASPSIAADTIKMGAVDYIEKSGNIDLHDLRARIKKQHDEIMEEKNSKTPNKISHATRGKRITAGSVSDEVVEVEMIGESQRLKKVQSQIERLAARNISILITGENGTGKELVARAIHNKSNRSHAPFMAINCAGLTSTLMKSLLFGSLKGSYTGSDKDEIGLIRAANKGTLFLDEIGEMPLDMQAALLRVLETRRVLPVGATREVEVDIRLIAATNRDLHQEIKNNNFKLDFYHRIRQMEIRVPSLIERREDIPLLVDFFLKKACEKEGLNEMSIEPTAMNMLLNHHWSGNIRELNNCIYTITCLSENQVVTEKEVAEFFENM